jgi:plastocyanin
MRFKWVPIAALAAGIIGWAVLNTGVTAEVRSQDPNIIMMDNCSPDDPAYDANDLGGCPEGSPRGANGYRGDVPLSELFALLVSPLAPGHVIGHPSWRNQPSYISIRSGQRVRVTNRGGRAHTFTRVSEFGGGFVPLLNETMTPAPECGENFVPAAGVRFVPLNETQTLPAMTPGLHKFQCCIHPWMRAAVRVD